MGPETTPVEIAQRYWQTVLFEHPLTDEFVRHAITNEGIGNGVSHLIGIATSGRHVWKLGLKIETALTPGLVDADLGHNPTTAIEHGDMANGARRGPLALAFEATLWTRVKVGCDNEMVDIIILSADQLGVSHEGSF
jgi:hypothetical protein